MCSTVQGSTRTRVWHGAEAEAPTRLLRGLLVVDLEAVVRDEQPDRPLLHALRLELVLRQSNRSESMQRNSSCSVLYCTEPVYCSIRGPDGTGPDRRAEQRGGVGRRGVNDTSRYPDAPHRCDDLDAVRRPRDLTRPDVLRSAEQNRSERTSCTLLQCTACTLLRVRRRPRLLQYSAVLILRISDSTHVTALSHRSIHK